VSQITFSKCELPASDVLHHLVLRLILLFYCNSSHVLLGCYKKQLISRLVKVNVLIVSGVVIFNCLQCCNIVAHNMNGNQQSAKVILTRLWKLCMSCYDYENMAGKQKPKAAVCSIVNQS